MRVLVIAGGYDTGGQGARMRDAFARYEPDWHVDSLALMASPLGYPDDYARWGGIKRRDLVPELYRLADVVHSRNHLGTWHRNGKPTVLHHHGTRFRTGHVAIARDAARVGAVQVASTIDLTLLERDVEWCPSPYDVDALAAMHQEHDGPVRVAHFPTNTTFKSSAFVLAAVQGLPVEFVHNLKPKAKGHNPIPWFEVLRLKSTADIYVDQLLLGYGNNAVEAWAMGLPVVAGVADPKVRAAMVQKWGQLPFVEANLLNLGTILKRLVDSSEMRAEYGAIGRAHVERWHSGAETVAVLRDAYQRAGLRQLRAVA